MKFERGKEPKRGLRIGKYSNMLKVHNIIWEVRGGQTITWYLQGSHARDFMKALAKGIRLIPTEMRIPGGLLREDYRLEVEYPKGGMGIHSSDIRGTSVEFGPTGEIFDIPEILEEKVYRYEL